MNKRTTMVEEKSQNELNELLENFSSSMSKMDAKQVFSYVVDSYTKPHNESMEFKQDCLAKIYAKYPYFFAKNISTNVNMPVGWIGHFEKALDAFAATGLSICITAISVKDDAIEVDTNAHTLENLKSTNFFARNAFCGEARLNALLQSMNRYCILCGASKPAENTNQHARRYSCDTKQMCTGCEKTFGLEPVLEDDNSYRF